MKRVLAWLAAVTLAAPLLVAATTSSAAASTCGANAKWTTTDLSAMWFRGKYVVANNGWNAGGYNVRQKIFVCSKGNWKVRARMDNRRGDGAVKTYPNVHRDWHNWSTGREPRLKTFTRIRARHQHRAPKAGIYNAAYDVWLNGVPGEHELMIWTHNRRQRPAGSVRARNVKIGGRSWTVWATSRRDSSYIAYVPKRNYRKGTTKVLATIRDAKRRGLLSPRVTVGQVGYGFEIVSTGGVTRTFKMDRFTMAVKRR
ncbi:glycosyl hydrolase family 12 [Mumia flava]|uniref:Glycosyl hydrolase family 12 n=1 Tax=Mumia flava TaxID=1348852 RepID=A0A0B2B4J2_9ACTN|nr:hypothetical protein [Mumia flava]PJJ53524.1 glycosyl hydrolase family 12 [Mumia flava]